MACLLISAVIECPLACGAGAVSTFGVVTGGSGWQRRFFVLHGTLITYWEEAESAEKPEEARCRGAAQVVEVERWQGLPGKLPPHGAPGKFGFKLITEDKEFQLCAESEGVCAQWVQYLSNAARLAGKTHRSRRDASRAADSFREVNIC